MGRCNRGRIICLNLASNGYNKLMKPQDKKLFAGTGRKLTKAEQKRKWELMMKSPNNTVVTNLDYRTGSDKQAKTIVLPSDNYAHYE